MGFTDFPRVVLAPPDMSAGNKLFSGRARLQAMNEGGTCGSVELRNDSSSESKFSVAGSNGEVEGPHTSALSAPQAHTVFQRLRR